MPYTAGGRPTLDELFCALPDLGLLFRWERDLAQRFCPRAVVILCWVTQRAFGIQPDGNQLALVFDQMGNELILCDYRVQIVCLHDAKI
ncbi:hypothetical protein CUR21_13325 [Pseudorhodobacter sp. MZDSW-24AT]|nr:hypothetical protein CUR21_13325 [Pseudorhodobacter sp. MZDSW-24AT]